MADGPATLEGITRALVVGAGRSGAAAARLLVDLGVRVVVVEEGPVVRDDVGLPPSVDLRVGAAAELHLDGIDLVVPSPGVPEQSAVLAAAADGGVMVWSEPELAVRVRTDLSLLGVTGTNGKTTVTELVTAMLVASGVDAMACGNIGIPLADVVRSPGRLPVLVAELSSFQLRFTDQLTPAVAAVLNLAPDHLDWHGSARAYAASKARIFNRQGPSDWVVAGDDGAARELTKAASSRRAEARSDRVPTVGVGVAGDWIQAALPDVDGPLLPVVELPSPARHQLANTAAAAAVALLAGATPYGVALAARATAPGPHRLQTVMERNGVRWVDDSKATNAHAAAAALESFPSVVWIAGGQAKGVDLTPLGAHLQAVHHAVLLGESADQIAAVCTAYGVPVIRAGTMREAVTAAAAVARAGDTVLLSPAGASFDLFEGYADRGARFAEAVQMLKDPP